eukprot:scpid85903/ scgid18560/ 
MAAIPLLVTFYFLIYSPQIGKYLKVPRVKVSQQNCPSLPMVSSTEAMTTLRLDSRCSMRSMFFDPADTQRRIDEQHTQVVLHNHVAPQNPLTTWRSANASANATQLGVRVPVKFGRRLPTNCSQLEGNGSIPEQISSNLVLTSQGLPRNHFHILDSTRDLILIARLTGEVEFVPLDTFATLRPTEQFLAEFRIRPTTKKEMQESNCHKLPA